MYGLACFLPFSCMVLKAWLWVCILLYNIFNHFHKRLFSVSISKFASIESSAAHLRKSFMKFDSKTFYWLKNLTSFVFAKVSFHRKSFTFKCLEQPKGNRRRLLGNWSYSRTKVLYGVKFISTVIKICLFSFGLSLCILNFHFYYFLIMVFSYKSVNPKSKISTNIHE